MAEIIDKESFFSLLIKASEGALSLQETAILNRCIHNDDSYAHLYVEFFDTLSGLNDLGENSVIFNNDRGSFNADILMSLLAQDEKTSPAVVTPKDDPETELIQKVIYKQDRSTINKTSLVIAMGSIAALVFLIVLVQLAPQSIVKPVATVKNCLGARFANNDSISTGSRLENRKEMYCLKNGVLEIEFDYGAALVIEGPAAFRIDSAEKICLNAGRVYACVPGSAKGFTVETPNSTIIDLGTEFGVQVEIDRNSSVHMLKGRASLIPGPKGKTGESLMLTTGQARRVNMNGTVQDIPLQSDYFARGIVSGIAWRGQSVNLSDIVGGGNGFGTGRQDHGIIIDTGQPSQGPLFITGHGIRYNKSWDAFCPVSQIPGIDGIFIPDGESRPVIVSSKGHIFDGCPDTNGRWSGPVTNGAKPINENNFKLIVDNVPYGTPENPAIYLHANIGITYDLNAVRTILPDNQSIARFASLVKAPTNPNKSTSLIDVWILVDGHVRFSKTNISQNQSFYIDVPLTEQDSFLSLVVTDGIGDRINDIKNERDWCFFCRPELLIESK